MQTYQVGEYTVTIASADRVNDEYQKVCLFHCDRKVKGFVNYHTREMWSVDSIPVVMHEFKHIVEGQFHSRPAPGSAPSAMMD